MAHKPGHRRGAKVGKVSKPDVFGKPKKKKKVTKKKKKKVMPKYDYQANRHRR